MKNILSVPLPAEPVEQHSIPHRNVFSNPILRRMLRGIFNALLTLLVIAYLAFFGLVLAERGRQRLPAHPLEAAGQAVIQTATYLFNHPATYLWHKAQTPWHEVVSSTLVNSAGLLLAAIACAAILGVSLGLLAARLKGKAGGALVVLISVLGMSTPSFLLGMLFWIFNIYVIHRTLDWTALPQAGFGWDLHIVMPALVLASRPLAQIAQVTYVSLTDVMNQDFIRTAKAKGLSSRLINTRHALRNVLIPVLTTMGTSLRYSLASLPVVEMFFAWPGVGLTLLQSLNSDNTTLIVDLITSLGAFFLVFNLFLDVLYPLIDPRLRKTSGAAEPVELPGWKDLVQGTRDTVAGFVTRIRQLLQPSKKESLPPLLAKLEQQHDGEDMVARRPTIGYYLRLVMGNPAFVVGSLLALALIFVAFFGENLVDKNPIEVHGVEMVGGVIGAPPFKPSETFPWGTDHIGRDVQAFVLAGARRTLMLAFFAMLSRVILGTVLGLFAGWWQGSWFDNFINRLMSIWAAFPVTIFAMLLIQALGIQQGTWVFIVALCVVGWGEVTQFVRAQTIRIKPQLYIEAARALGAQPGHLLGMQVFPNLVPSLLVISALEMAGVLMLLAELGFLNIFLGGGFTVELFVDKVITFSDVPEWGAMLANVLGWWRSYPWMAWYPGAAFFISIVAFNLFGEGLRHFIEESRINLSRIFNRYTFTGSLAVVLVAFFVLQQAAPIHSYKNIAKEFDVTNVMVDIGTLSGPEFEGRESGTESAIRSANYIATRMEEAGLFFSTLDKDYTQTTLKPREHLLEMPFLNALDNQGNVIESFGYRTDFAEWVELNNINGTGKGQLASIAFGPPGDEKADKRAINPFDMTERILIVNKKDVNRLPRGSQVGGIIVIDDDPGAVQKKFLFYQVGFFTDVTPMVVVTPQAADRLLNMGGSSLSEFEEASKNLETGQVLFKELLQNVELSVNAPENTKDKAVTVVGILSGTGSNTQGETPGVGLDQEAIIVSAYYDGLGTSPDGTIYPGANDNASGVATMLEIARVLKESGYAPKRTILFVAWTGGDRYEQLSISDVINASSVLNGFKIQGVIELSGVGAGSGRGIALGEGSSYRLVKLFQSAASIMNVSTTTRGRNPHYGLPELRLAVARDVPSLYITWDGSDHLAHTTFDAFEAIDMKKIQKVARSTLLMLTVMSREVNY